ncbi:hypothetical protein [Sphingobacterium psychroaquaticum]|uniref:Uncharacterized protein n=1 Tax=Sphingobacterium psychroaquaticum TaxID=561061 RepID=A0A1X7L7W2_9SPHI|nr:hypothetical protein [Sphingobacterium psychroaquaticum]QBQ42396.1 hypothetical protein E2P86_15065 [Sphingobacterium psychroaquaticum]SMG49938.1 hypothetical protein SAMN05660862_3722 [Sphingobacterium psychroaquaticum]
MILKLIHFFVLLCYVNILAYEVGVNAHTHEGILNGESILEFVLDDVLDIPISKTSEDVTIPYDEYRSMSHQSYLIPLFVFLITISFAIASVMEQPKHPKYDGKKRQIFPGYYAFLYRYKPF